MPSTSGEDGLTLVSDSCFVLLLNYLPLGEHDHEQVHEQERERRGDAYGVCWLVGGRDLLQHAIDR